MVLDFLHVQVEYGSRVIGFRRVRLTSKDGHKSVALGLQQASGRFQLGPISIDKK